MNRRWWMLACSAVLGVSLAARADLSDEVRRETKPLADKRGGEVKAADREAAAKQKRALAELGRAEQKAKEAQKRLQQIADEAERASAAAKAQAAQLEAAQQASARAHAGVEALQALDAAATKIARGDHQIEAELARASSDPALKRAATALAAAAAYLTGDDAKVNALLTPELLGAYPSSKRWLGLAKLRQGDREAAYSHLKAAPLQPGDTLAHSKLGELALAHKDLATARSAYQAAWKSAPHDGALALALGKILIALGQTKEALSPLGAAAAEAGGQEGAYLLAVALDRSGDTTKAELAWGRVVGADSGRTHASASSTRIGRTLDVLQTAPPWESPPDQLDVEAARRRLASLRLDRGDPEGALQLVAKAPETAEVLYLRGLCTLAAERFAEALAHFEAAQKLAPSRAEIGLGAAIALLQLGDAPRAHELLVKLPVDDRIQLATALALFRMGKTEPAVELSRRLASSKLVGDLAATNWAAQLMGKARREEILAALGKPKTAEGQLLLARLQLDGNPAASKAAARAAIELRPTFADAFLASARAEEQLGELEGAERSAQRVLELSPDALDARILLARVYGRRGDLQRQASELARIRQVSESIQAAQPRRTVAVIAFDNNTGDVALDWMRHGVAEALVSDLSRIGSLTLIERTQLQKGFAEQKLQELGFADPTGAAKVGKLVGADALLVGQIAKGGDLLRLDGRIVDLQTNKVLRTGSAQGKATDLFELERRLALDLVAEYAAVTPRERMDLFAAPHSSLKSLETVAKVRALTAEGRDADARAQFQRLLAEDPQAAEKLRALQRSWADKGATVAVVPLHNASGRTEEQWVGVGLAEALTTDLRKVGLFLVERQQVERLMQERRLTEIFNPTQAAGIGRLVGATLLVIGSYQVAGERLRVDTRLVDVASGEVIQSYSAEGRSDELFAVERQLIAKMSSALKVDPGAIDDKALAQGKPSFDDFKRYIQSSSRLAIGRAAGEVRVRSLAVGTVRRAEGGDDAAGTALLKLQLEKRAAVAVRLTAATDAKQAGADVLVLGTVSRVGNGLRIDLRGVASQSGEVVAAGTAEGKDEQAYDEAARQLAESLGVLRKGEKQSQATPLHKKWWLWTIVGAVVVGGVAAGTVLGTQQRLPYADTTLVTR